MKKVYIIVGIVLSIFLLWFVASFFGILPGYYCGEAMGENGPFEVCGWSYGLPTY